MATTSSESCSWTTFTSSSLRKFWTLLAAFFFGSSAMLTSVVAHLVITPAATAPILGQPLVQSPAAIEDEEPKFEPVRLEITSCLKTSTKLKRVSWSETNQVIDIPATRPRASTWSERQPVLTIEINSPTLSRTDAERHSGRPSTPRSSSVFTSMAFKYPSLPSPANSPRRRQQSLGRPSTPHPTFPRRLSIQDVFFPLSVSTPTSSSSATTAQAKSSASAVNVKGTPKTGTPRAKSAPDAIVLVPSAPVNTPSPSKRLSVVLRSVQGTWDSVRASSRSNIPGPSLSNSKSKFLSLPRRLRLKPRSHERSEETPNRSSLNSVSSDETSSSSSRSRMGSLSESLMPMNEDVFGPISMSKSAEERLGELLAKDKGELSEDERAFAFKCTGHWLM